MTNKHSKPDAYNILKKSLDKSTRRDARNKTLSQTFLQPKLLSYPVYMHMVGMRYRFLPKNFMSIRQVYKKLCDYIGVKQVFRRKQDIKKYEIRGLALKTATNIHIPAHKIRIERAGFHILIWYEGSIPLGNEDALCIPTTKSNNADVILTLLVNSGICEQESIRYLGTDEVEFICFLNNEGANAVAEYVNKTTYGYDEIVNKDYDKNNKKHYLAAGKKEMLLDESRKLEIQKKVYCISDNEDDNFDDDKEIYRLEVCLFGSRTESRDKSFKISGDSHLWSKLLAELVETIFAVGAKPVSAKTPRVKFPEEKPKTPRWYRNLCSRIPIMGGRNQQAIILKIIENGGEIGRTTLAEMLPDCSRSTLSNSILFLERCGVICSLKKNNRRISLRFCEQFRLDDLKVLLKINCEQF